MRHRFTIELEHPVGVIRAALAGAGLPADPSEWGGAELELVLELPMVSFDLVDYVSVLTPEESAQVGFGVSAQRLLR